LLYRNDETRWPESMGDDLSSRYPGIVHANYASDGATIGDVFGEQLSRLPEDDAPTLVTLTVGGNDLLSAFGSHRQGKLLERIGEDIAEAHELLDGAIRRMLTRSTVIATTVYDPSDRTARIPCVYDDDGA